MALDFAAAGLAFDAATIAGDHQSQRNYRNCGYRANSPMAKRMDACYCDCCNPQSPTALAPLLCMPDADTGSADSLRGSTYLSMPMLAVAFYAFHSPLLFRK